MEVAEMYLEGKILLFNKPLNWTSFDVVKKVKSKLYYKYKLKKIKVGHAGTLDPLADGLMLICTGKATKKLNEFQDFDKEYVAKIGLGKTTPSCDLETEFDHETSIDHIEIDEVKKVLEGFKGVQEQVPPIFSAKKIDGKRAYEMAREKIEVKMTPARIEISEIELVEWTMPFIIVRVRCSKGTYIRALARDIGERLKCGAYLAGLKRTAIGPYHLNEALAIEKFEEIE